MKFLADENIPVKSVQMIRENGIDVTSIGEDHPAVSDIEVVEIANKENRTILTFDKDFGELIYRFDLKPKAGLIHFRLLGFEPEEPAKVLLNMLEIGDIQFSKRITVVDNKKVRQRKY